MIKTNKIALILMAAFFSNGVMADDKSKETQTRSFYENIKIEKVDNKQANDILKSYYKDYNKYLLSINKEMDSIQREMKKSFDGSYKNASNAIISEKSSFEENCSGKSEDLTDAKKQECSGLKTSITSLESEIKNLSAKEKTEFDSIEKDRLMRMDDLYKDYKKSVTNLMSQLKERTKK